MKRSRRLKRVCYSLDNEPGKFELIAMMRKLPDDAKLLRMNEDPVAAEGYMIFYSSEWDEVPEGMQVPELTIWINNNDVANASAHITPPELNPPAPGADDFRIVLPPGMTIDHDALRKANRDQLEQLQRDIARRHSVTPAQLGCKCDLAYTGSKQHNANCPLRK